jgi:Ser/Thr protein kinase RdoA (MazF antagonist)
VSATLPDRPWHDPVDAAHRRDKRRLRPGPKGARGCGGGRRRARTAAAFPGLAVQPIHGDAPTYNLIVTRDGALVSDFEHVTRAPVEWDLVFADEAARAAYDAAAAELGLRPLDERLLRVMESARMIQLVACLPMAPQLPGLLDGLRPAVEHWRAGPPLGRLLL